MKRFKICFHLIFVIAAIFLIPIITDAADIQWTSEGYWATAWGPGGATSVSAYGPPLPVSAVYS